MIVTVQSTLILDLNLASSLRLALQNFPNNFQNCPQQNYPEAYLTSMCARSCMSSILARDEPFNIASNILMLCIQITEEFKDLGMWRRGTGGNLSLDLLPLWKIFLLNSVILYINILDKELKHEGQLLNPVMLSFCLKIIDMAKLCPVSSQKWLCIC